MHSVSLGIDRQVTVTEASKLNTDGQAHHALTPDTTEVVKAGPIEWKMLGQPWPKPSPIHDQAKKATKTDSILLTIGIILDGTDRDLTWALWAIQRELVRRRG